jgi:hypothetical protein
MSEKPLYYIYFEASVYPLRTPGLRNTLSSGKTKEMNVSERFSIMKKQPHPLVLLQ